MQDYKVGWTSVQLVLQVVYVLEVGARWCLSVRARLLPLGALPFRRARPREPTACQTDLCSKQRRENVRRSPETKNELEGKRVGEDLRERGVGLRAGGEWGLLPSRHTLHVKRSCTENS